MSLTSTSSYLGGRTFLLIGASGTHERRALVGDRDGTMTMDGRTVTGPKETRSRARSGQLNTLEASKVKAARLDTSALTLRNRHYYRTTEHTVACLAETRTREGSSLNGSRRILRTLKTLYRSLCALTVRRN